MMSVPLQGTFPERIESARLVLRRPRTDEAADCGRRLYEAEATRAVPLTRERAELFGSFMVEHWRRYEFGFLVAERRDDGVVLGHSGFKYTDAFPGHWPEHFDAIELGYALLPAFRGQGYATEAGRAALAAAFAAFDIPSIRGRCNVDNRASANVLERCGMRELHTDRTRRFEISRP